MVSFEHESPVSASTARPWYRQPWLWLLLAPPLAAVLAGVATLFVAVHHADTLVRDDYVRTPFAVSRRPDRDRRAAELGLAAIMVVDRAGGRLDVQLTNAAPDSLTVHLWHPTRADRDLTTQLVPSEGGYRGVFEPPAGRWFIEPADRLLIEIEPPDKSWRLVGELSASASEATLSPPRHVEPSPPRTGEAQ